MTIIVEVAGWLLGPWTPRVVTVESDLFTAGLAAVVTTLGLHEFGRRAAEDAWLSYPVETPVQRVAYGGRLVFFGVPAVMVLVVVGLSLTAYREVSRVVR